MTAADEVQVWTVDLDPPEHDAQADWSCLDDDERRRAARFVFAADRRRFVGRRAALRRVLAERMACRPVDVRYAIGRFGRPRVPGHALDFSLSHRGERALIAVTGSGRPGETVAGRLGVDIERLAIAHAEPGMLQHHVEAAALGPCDAALRAGEVEPFFRWWTVVEAVAKARGTGLAEEPPVQAAAGWLDRPVALRDEFGVLRRWALHCWAPEPGFVAALAHTAAPQAVRLRGLLPAAAPAGHCGACA